MSVTFLTDEVKKGTHVNGKLDGPFVDNGVGKRGSFCQISLQRTVRVPRDLQER